MFKIGLSGGIACGKSTVANILQTSGIPVIDADEVAREVVSIGTPALKEIIENFGTKVLQQDGSLDRKRLGAEVMTSNDKLKKLNKITHPRIRQSIEKQLYDYKRLGHLAAVVEAALLVETKSHLLYDAIIIVSCSPEVQIKRLMLREGFERKTALTWISNQMPTKKKEAFADLLIHNNKDHVSLEKSVHDGWQKLLKSLRASQH